MVHNKQMEKRPVLGQNIDHFCVHVHCIYILSITGSHFLKSVLLADTLKVSHMQLQKAVQSMLMELAIVVTKLGIEIPTQLCKNMNPQLNN